MRRLQIVTEASAVRQETPQRLAKGADSDPGLTLQHIGRVGLAPLNQLSNSLACGVQPPSQFLGQAHAGVEVCANTVGEVGAAMWTEVHAIVEKIRSQLELPVALPACRAFGNRVVEAVPEQECSFFRTHGARAPAVQMDETIAVEREGIVRGNGLLAPPALRLSPLFHRRRSYPADYLQRRSHHVRSRLLCRSTVTKGAPGVRRHKPCRLADADRCRCGPTHPP